jgi:hypothetical protein
MKDEMTSTEKERKAAMRSRRARLWRVGLLVASMGAIAPGCDSTGPETIESVQNNTDDFRFDLPSQSDFSGTFRYQWSNSGSGATISLTTVPADGIGTLTVQDADNATVFTGSVTEAGTFMSDSGRPGTWTITALLVRIAGRLTFRVQKS